MNRVLRSDLQVVPEFAEFVEDRMLPGTGVAPDQFWNGFSDLVHELNPRRIDLLAKREDIQSKIDDWHKERRGKPHDDGEYRKFLEAIGYIGSDGPDFEISTEGVDPEIATIAGPQLVVPITNARFALNAANARWNSLYDALYGTDALGDLPDGATYDPAPRQARGEVGQGFP